MHNASFGEKNVPFDYFVGHKHGRVFSCHCIVLLYVSSQRNNLIKLTHYDETKKIAHGS